MTPALTVHDMGAWAPHRLADFEGDERERVLTEDGWLRFTIVRDPVRRVWSAWQSKLLLREPRFVDRFGDQPWFPRLPERPAEIREDFRRFVAAIPTGTAEDVHWAVQRDLAAQLPLTHVGRLERFDETLALLREHVGDRWPGDPARENPSRVPMPADAYDAAGAEVLRERYAADLEAYGYEVPEPAADPGWEDQVAALLPLLRGTTQQHARIGQLQSRLRRAERWSPSRPVEGVLTNLEGHADYDVRRPEGEIEPGFTAVLRVRDEARSLPFVLPPLLRAVKRVVVIDNRSTDGTADVARRVAAEEGATDRLEVRATRSRSPAAGRAPRDPGRLGAQPGVLLQLVVLARAHRIRAQVGRRHGAHRLCSRSGARPCVAARGHRGGGPDPPPPALRGRRAVGVPRRRARNYEPWGWPNRPEQRFVKAMEWELPLWFPDVGVTLPEHSCFELKFLEADEFDHWSDTDFDAPGRTRRKQREYDVFNAVAGGGDPPEGVMRIEAPAGEHIIDYVRTSWLTTGSPALASVG